MRLYLHNPHTDVTDMFPGASSPPGTDLELPITASRSSRSRFQDALQRQELQAASSVAAQQQQTTAAVAAALGALIGSLHNNRHATLSSSRIDDPVRVSHVHSSSRSSLMVNPTGTSGEQQHRHHRSLADSSSSDGSDSQLWNMPGDPTGGEMVLQSLDPLLSLLPFSPFLSPISRPATRSRSSSSDSNGSTSSSSSSLEKDSSSSVRSYAYQGNGTSQLVLQVTFLPLANFNTSLRLPLPPRSFYVTLEDEVTADKGTCGEHGLSYKDQAVYCSGLVKDRDYTVTLFDTGEIEYCLGLVAGGLGPAEVSRVRHK